jgi:hypothetical protein
MIPHLLPIERLSGKKDLDEVDFQRWAERWYKSGARRRQIYRPLPLFPYRDETSQGVLAGVCMRGRMDASSVQPDHYPDRTTEERVLTNAELQREIAASVLEVLGSGEREVRVSPWQILDFSSIFSIDWRAEARREGIFVKIPTVALRKRQVGLVTHADRSFAAAEYDSLVRLSRDWDGADLGVSFVKPLAYQSSYNAIVTQRAYAREFFAFFRHRDLCCRGRGPGADDQARGCLNRLGQALARFHQVCGKERLFEAEATEKKIRGYLDRLREMAVDPGFISQIRRALEWLRGKKCLTLLTDTIKGLDVRNILIDADDRLFLLDPGKLKRDYREADLARFLVTCKILYWGSPWFFLRLTPHRGYDQSFLQGYYGKERPTWLLTLFTIKELLKHWLMAHVALGLNRWPRPLKAGVKRTYIDPFYQQQIEVELQKLAPGSRH